MSFFNKFSTVFGLVICLLYSFPVSAGVSGCDRLINAVSNSADYNLTNSIRPQINGDMQLKRCVKRLSEASKHLPQKLTQEQFKQLTDNMHFSEPPNNPPIVPQIQFLFSSTDPKIVYAGNSLKINMRILDGSSLVNSDIKGARVLLGDDVMTFPTTATPTIRLQRVETTAIPTIRLQRVDTVNPKRNFTVTVAIPESAKTNYMAGSEYSIQLLREDPQGGKPVPFPDWFDGARVTNVYFEVFKKPEINKVDGFLYQGDGRKPYSTVRVTGENLNALKNCPFNAQSEQITARIERPVLSSSVTFQLRKNQFENKYPMAVKVPVKLCLKGEGGTQVPSVSINVPVAPQSEYQSVLDIDEIACSTEKVTDIVDAVSGAITSTTVSTNLPNDNLFKPACARHDFCYRAGARTYNKSKDECDILFNSDMEDICEKEAVKKAGAMCKSIPKGNIRNLCMAPIKIAVKKTCDANQSAYIFFTETFGRDSYRQWKWEKVQNLADYFNMQSPFTVSQVEGASNAKMSEIHRRNRPYGSLTEADTNFMDLLVDSAVGSYASMGTNNRFGSYSEMMMEEFVVTFTDWSLSSKLIEYEAAPNPIWAIEIGVDIPEENREAVWQWHSR